MSCSYCLQFSLQVQKHCMLAGYSKLFSLFPLSYRNGTFKCINGRSDSLNKITWPNITENMETQASVECSHSFFPECLWMFLLISLLNKTRFFITFFVFKVFARRHSSRDRHRVAQLFQTKELLLPVTIAATAVWHQKLQNGGVWEI